MSTSEPRHRHGGSLVPMGNLASLLVPVGLVVGQLVWPWGATVAPETAPTSPTSLALSILLEPQGYVVVADGHTVALTCGGCADPHAPQALQEHLRSLKSDHPDAMTVVVVPGRRSDYATLMRAIRAAREDAHGVLFPQAIIAGDGE